MEESFAKLPGFLRELRSTMVELDRFSDASTPVFSDLGNAAPALTRLNRALGPFSSAGTNALTSLGEASEDSAGPLVASDPVIRQLRDLAEEGAPATKNTAKLLASFRKTDGFEYLLRTIFGASGAVNAFDSYGHFVRALIPVNNCFDYTAVPQSGCDAGFIPPLSALTRAEQRAEDPRRERSDKKANAAEAAEAGGLLAPLADLAPEGDDPGTPRVPQAPSGSREPSPQAAPGEGGVGGRQLRAAKDLLDFLIGDPAGAQGGQR
jgi:hypothetical protein